MNDCITDNRYKLNKDGYLRIRNRGRLIFKHRLVWFEAGRNIPNGYAVF